jgi:hypothetical protein
MMLGLRATPSTMWFSCHPFVPRAISEGLTQCDRQQNDKGLAFVTFYVLQDTWHPWLHRLPAAAWCQQAACAAPTWE